MKATFWITAISVSLMSITVTSMITFYLFKKKERAILRKAHSGPQTEASEQRKKDFFDIVSFDCSGSIKQHKETKRGGGRHNKKIYPYLECPPNNVYAKNNKWINKTATHNTSHVGETVEKEDAIFVGICNVVTSGLEGKHFIIEDIYGQITTEPTKFKKEISADELRNRLIVFEGHIENKKFTVKNVSKTKIKTAWGISGHL